MKYTFTLITFFAICLSAFAQEITVKGIVFESETRAPLLGATVLQKGTTNGITTDFDGNFSLPNVNVGDVLVVSYVGFKTREVIVPLSGSINIFLDSDLAALDEVIIVGYGTQRKKEITGSVSVVSSQSIEELKPVQIEQALQGQVAGVQITPSSGAPGSQIDIKIRGISTNGDNRPLILLDGSVIEDLTVVNPSDIESINVLKDATAGIYGVRAANGVILITTKNGSYGSDLKVNFSSYVGIQQTSRKIPTLNATEYALLVNEARTNGGESPLFTDIGSLGQGTDWQDEVFENAPIYNADINLTGGTKNSRTSFSISYLDQDGIVGGPRANFNRFTSRLSHDRKILKNLKFDSSLLFTGINRENIAENAIGSVLYNALNNSPLFPVRNQDNSFSISEGTGNEVINPVAQIANANNTTRVKRLTGSFALNYKFLENFTAETRMQANYSEVNEFRFFREANFGSGKVFNIARGQSRVEDIDRIFRDYTFDAFVNYNKSFNEVHNLDVTIGTSIFQTTGIRAGFIGTGFDRPGGANFNGSVLDANEVISINQNGGATFDSRLLSYFARTQYDYKGKYLFSGVIRRDGSTKFGPENKFGIFPSASAGWIISDEDFLANNNKISFLKLRSSYGVLGNDRIGDFRFQSNLNGEGVYVFEEQLVFGSAIGGLSNPEIRWEKQFTFDVGIDAKFFDNSLDVTLDYFNRRTEDLLLQPQVSGILGGSAPGSSPPFVNAGTIRNRGLEFSVGYRKVLSDNFKYNVNFNVTSLDNEVLEVNGENSFIPGGSFGIGQEPPSRMETGFDIGYFRGFQTNGIFQTQEEVDNHAIQDNAQPGDLRFVDTNGDGVITTDDKVDLGSPIPDFTFGINLGFTFKNFDFVAYAFSQVGNEIVRNYERFNPLTNRSTQFLGRWTGPGSTNEVPRVTTSATQNIQFSDFFVEDGSFIRLQNIQVGYTFSEEFMQNFKLNSVRLYTSVNNLYTFTKYRGYDPTASSGAPIGGGIDQGFYPTPTTFIFGVNVNF